MKNLSLAQKRKIVTFCEKNKKLSYQKVANAMSDVLGRPMSREQIYRVWRKRELILNAPNSDHGHQVKSDVDQKFETELCLKLKNVKFLTQNNATFLAIVQRQKAQYRESCFKNYKFGRKWYSNFCKRYQLKSFLPIEDIYTESSENVDQSLHTEVTYS